MAMISYPLNEENLISLRTAVIAALKGIYDPEIPVNIYDLGLIYQIFINPGGLVKIEMTLTSPGCPVAQTFPGTVESEINKVTGVSETQVELVWDPPWSSEKMSMEAKLELNLL